MLVRLQKIIADAGIASRRAAEKLITAGKVTVNGETVTELGVKADPDKDTVAVDGKQIKVSGKKLYLMMNKPVGYVTTMKDPEGRPIVTDLLKGISERVYPVGRLDYTTSGLLLLTNDGELANRLMHPRHEVEKTYRVKVRGSLTDDQLGRLRRPNRELGFRAPKKVLPEREKKTDSPARGLVRNSWIVIIISEGKNRQIRRMIESVGGTVLKLERIRYGNLDRTGIKVGEFRHLTPREIHYLKTI